MAKSRTHSITYADLNEVIDVLIDDRTALKRGIMSLIDQAFKEGKNPPKSTKQSAEEIYLEKAVKLCRYPAFLYGRYISVPIGQEEIAMQDLTVSHLVNSHKFSIQPCVPDALPEVQVFDPQFRERQEATPITDITMPQRGEVWRYKPDNERWYIKSATDKQFGITILDSMKSDKTKGLDDVERMIRSGDLYV